MRKEYLAKADNPAFTDFLHLHEGVLTNPAYFSVIDEGMKFISPQIPAILALLTTVTPGASAQDAVDPYRKAPVAAPAQQTSNQIHVSVETQSFSLPIDDAFKLLREHPSDSARFERLAKLVEEGKARLERLLLARTKSGQRSVLESIDEVRYPVEYGFSSELPKPSSEPSTSAPGKNLLPIPQKFETRNSGDTLEVEPVVRPDNTTVDLSIVLQSVQYQGLKDSEGVSGLYQPGFGTCKVTTSATVRVGVPLLLTIADPAFNSGIPKLQEERRVWFQFVTAKAVDPAGAPVQESDGPTAASAKAWIIGSIDFVNATPKEAVEMLRAKSAEFSPDRKGTNIVLKLPPSFDQTRINLSLKVVSVYDALRYVAATIGAEVTAEDPALIVHVKGDRP